MDIEDRSEEVEDEKGVIRFCMQNPVSAFLSFPRLLSVLLCCTLADGARGENGREGLTVSYPLIFPRSCLLQRRLRPGNWRGG